MSSLFIFLPLSVPAPRSNADPGDHYRPSAARSVWIRAGAGKNIQNQEGIYPSPGRRLHHPLYRRKMIGFKEQSHNLQVVLSRIPLPCCTSSVIIKRTSLVGKVAPPHLSPLPLPFFFHLREYSRSIILCHIKFGGQADARIESDLRRFIIGKSYLEVGFFVPSLPSD